MFPVLRRFGRLRWLRRGVRYRLIRIFSSPDGIADHEYETSFFSLKYRGNLKTHIDWEVFFFGAYEASELEFLRTLAPFLSSKVILDIGANIGHHTLFFSRLARHVHAFEPFDQVRRTCEQRIEDNQLDNVTIHPVGLGAENEQLQYFAPREINTGTGSFVPGHAADNNTAAGRLEVCIGDEYLAKFDIDDIGLVKIDVEGFERNVLAGLQQTLRANRPLIVMEFSTDTRESMGDIETLMNLLPENYVIHRIVVDEPRAVLFNRCRAHLQPFDFSSSRYDLLMMPAGVELPIRKRRQG